MKSKSLKQGTKIEMEHTKGNKFVEKKRSKSPKDMARKIAKDHVEEMGNSYYPELKRMEGRIKRKKVNK